MGGVASFALLLKQYRAAAGLTQEELAERANLSARAISDLERGVKHRPYPHTVQRLVQTLGLSEDEASRLQRAARGYSSPQGERSMHEVPIRTFLVADLRGYSTFTREQGDEAAGRLAARFAGLVREVVAAGGGDLVELRGDEALATFTSARGALRAALELTHTCAGETERDPSLPLWAGIGLDAGEAVPVEGGYRGGALNLAARLCSLAGPGEVLASEWVIHLAGKTDGLGYRDRGAAQLKGFAEPVRVVQVQVGEGPESGERETETERARPLPIGGFLGALPARPLVARQEELHSVLSAADAVAVGSGRLVLLVGEPGVGKTRLAQEVTLELRDAAFLVASGRCYEPQEAVPFYPFLEALGTLFAAAPPSIRDALPQRWPSMARLLPGDNLSIPSSSSEGPEEQERLFWSVTGFVQTVAEQAPVALLLDDLHWADGTSLALLQHLARHTRAYRVLLLGTYRDVEVGRQHPLERALRDLHREGLAERIPIRRLGEEDTAALIATAFGQEEVAEAFSTLVHRHTEGNPFFTHEVLRTLVERGDIYQEEGRWEQREVKQIEVPESVRSTIGERLSRLDEATQELLHAASILGQIFHFDALAAMADVSEEEVERALEEAIDAGLIREIGRDQYSFNHALTQQALYAELSSRRRRRLHLAAGEALEHAGPSEDRAAELSWHFLEGDEPQRGLRYAIQAGDKAEEVYAHHEAERHYRTALELARETRDRAREVEALEKLGSVLHFQGRYDEALVLLEQAVELYRMESDPEGQGRIEAMVGMVHYAKGTSREGITRLEAVLPSLESHVSPPVLASLYAALVYAALVQCLFTAGECGENLEATERYLEVARAAGDKGILARAYGRYGLALALLGRTGEAIPAYEEALALADVSGDPRALQYSPFDLAELYLYVGEMDKSTALRRSYLELTKQLGNPDDLALAHNGLAENELVLGQWDEARAHLEQAESISHNCTSSYATSWTLLSLGQLCLLQGDHEAASRYLEAGLRIDQRDENIQGIRNTQRLLAEMDLRHSRPQAAVARLEPLLDRPGLQEGQVALLLPVLAEARLELAHDLEGFQQVEIAVHEALERASAQNNRVLLAEVLRVQGLLLTRQGDWDGAERAFEDAVSLGRSILYPYAEARALYEFGRMLGMTGETIRSRERLEGALQIFRRLGAWHYVERTEAALAVPR